jgi:hypothetical protein
MCLTPVETSKAREAKHKERFLFMFDDFMHSYGFIDELSELLFLLRIAQREFLVGKILSQLMKVSGLI